MKFIKQNRMEWKKLLQDDKLCEKEELSKEFDRYPMNAFDIDFRKIVSSAPFRRLQDKTQVFPLDKSDFIRTRLTHSLEVSSIGKLLGIMLCNDKNSSFAIEDIQNEKENIPSILACAGLLHDLGNPPFGHFGETTIADWFKENLKKLEYNNEKLNCLLNKQMINDLENFEGNAQAFRILCKASYGQGIAISYSVISTLMKYPTHSLHFGKTYEDIKHKKFGYFLAEQGEFEKISKHLGTTLNDTVERHPLAYLLEAADDISYLSSDLEDAFKKDLFKLDEFIQYYKSQLDDFQNNKSKTKDFLEDLEDKRKKYDDDSVAFSEWIEYVRMWLTYSAVFGFSKSYETIISGKCKEDVFNKTFHKDTVEILKKIMIKFVFNHESILKLELSSQTILSFLLDKFVKAVINYDSKEEKMSKADKKYIVLISNNYKEDYHKSKKQDDENYNLYLRILMVTDYISGMTDSYARTLYRELSGIE